MSVYNTARYNMVGFLLLFVIVSAANDSSPVFSTGLRRPDQPHTPTIVCYNGEHV